jgi:hypothetical protein
MKRTEFKEKKKRLNMKEILQNQELML